MSSVPRITEQTERVFKVLLGSDLTAGLYGLEIGQNAGLPSGTVHPILARWERAGVLESYWGDEAGPPVTQVDGDDKAAGSRRSGPRRRYYRFTPDGAQYVRFALAALDNERRARDVELRLPGTGLAGGLAQ